MQNFNKILLPNFQSSEVKKWKNVVYINKDVQQSDRLQYYYEQNI